MHSADQDAVLEFWIGNPAPGPEELEKRISFWFEASPEVDAEIDSRFSSTLRDAPRGDLDDWRMTPRGRLALIILLDQVSRNLNRESKAAFASDSDAVAVCLEGIELGHDVELTVIERAFFYMPLQHAEELLVQDKSLEVFEQLVVDCSDAIRPHVRRFAASAKSHRDIISKFGRFPHRNELLGRECTKEEIDFLTVGMIPFRQKG